MATFKRFEELPAWNAATDLAVAVFKLTEAPSFRFKGDLVNQLRRAALSVANNIAEGFERGSTAELVTFLYISRGSAGEVRSMLHFSTRLGEMPGEADAIARLVAQCEAVSRQIGAWISSLQNSDIAGQRHLNDASRAAYEQKKKDEEFRERFAAYRAKMEEMLRDGTWAKPGVEQPQLFPVPSAQAEKPAPPDAPPACPACGQPMVKRRSRDGAEFWGCSAYPACKGHRSIR